MAFGAATLRKVLIQAIGASLVSLCGSMEAAAISSPDEGDAAEGHEQLITAPLSVEANGADELDALVECRAILADVAWSHQIWPDENPTPKPARSEHWPDEEIRWQTEDLLRKESALRSLYGIDLDSKALEGELRRMSQSTQQPDRLRGVFAALRNDVDALANCVARPLLIERRLQQAYARDDRLHGALRRAAERALQEGAQAAALEQSGGIEQIWALVRDDSDEVGHGQGHGEAEEVRLAGDEFSKARERLLNRVQAWSDSVELPAIRRHHLQETANAFIEETVLSKTEDRVLVRTRVWKKQGYREWWKATRTGYLPDLAWRRLSGVQVPQIQGKWSASNSTTGDSWRVFDVPAGRSAHTAVWTGSEMIIWGGSTIETASLSTGGRYDPVTDSWSATAIAGAPSARTNHSAVWTGTEMIVWGGRASNAIGALPFSTGGRYNPATDSWTETSAVGAPSERSFHTAVWTGSEMIIWGGSTLPSESLASGGRYRPDLDAWVPTSMNGAPSARTNHTAVWSDSEMIVWGGCCFLNTGGRYNPVSDSWVATPTAGAPSQRERHVAVWAGTEMLVWGGRDPVALATGGRFNPSTGTWSSISLTNAPRFRTGHKAIWTGEQMIVWGGVDGVAYLSTGGLYRPSTNTWDTTSEIGAPRATAGHTAVWTGSEMIIWGSVFPASDTGGRYKPATNSWTPTANSGSPQPREGHTAVWTGIEMIVWGGRGVSGGFDRIHFNDGGRYDPATNNWVTTSTIDAPSARASHTAVWTGSEILIWGGGGPAPVSSGGRYNPIADAWTETPVLGAPDARLGHTAVWTGTEMIIAKGDVNGSMSNTAGHFNPVTNAWLRIAFGSPRSEHTAIWTGSEVILLGGRLSPNLGLFGEAYSPSTLKVRILPSSGTSSPRVFHTMVWTGTEVIVWGGQWLTFDPAFGTGVSYRPLDDSWRTVNTACGPSARQEHTAVWTGREMIVWGGRGLSAPSVPNFETGGRYNPDSSRWVDTTVFGAPSPRRNHTAVWIGDAMIIFGGTGPFAELGVYRPGPLVEGGNQAEAVLCDGFELE